MQNPFFFSFFFFRNGHLELWIRIEHRTRRRHPHREASPCLSATSPWSHGTNGTLLAYQHVDSHAGAATLARPGPAGQPTCACACLNQACLLLRRARVKRALHRLWAPAGPTANQASPRRAVCLHSWVPLHVSRPGQTRHRSSHVYRWTRGLIVPILPACPCKSSLSFCPKCVFQPIPASATHHRVAHLLACCTRRLPAFKSSS